MTVNYTLFSVHQHVADISGGGRYSGCAYVEGEWWLVLTGYANCVLTDVECIHKSFRLSATIIETEVMWCFYDPIYGSGR